MGNNGYKAAKEEKTYVNNHKPELSVSNTVHDSDSQYESESELSKKLPTPKEQHNKLKSPHNERPLELSWLQQNNSHDHYNRMNPPPPHHRHQHHQHHQEHLRRKPLAINRWPKDDDQIEKQKSKSFIEEYIHQ